MANGKWQMANGNGKAADREGELRSVQLGVRPPARQQLPEHLRVGGVWRRQQETAVGWLVG